MNAGIYRINSPLSGHFYIGQSINLEVRWKYHKYLLSLQKHHNRYLQNVSNKYGLDTLIFEVLTYCPIPELDRYEQQYIDASISNPLCVNISIDAKNPVKDLPRTQEWKERIGKAHKGRKLSVEAKEKIRAARAIQIFPDGCRDEYYNSIRGKPRDPVIVQKIACALKGKKLSKEHIESLISSHPGKVIIGTHFDGTQIEFGSIREAALFFKCTKSAIAFGIRKRIFTTRLSAKLYGWKFQLRIYLFRKKILSIPGRHCVLV
jgi:group I intron endonuclease